MENILIKEIQTKDILQAVDLEFKMGQGFVDTRFVARDFKKDHKEVIRQAKELITKYENENPIQGVKPLMVKKEYLDKKGETRPYYLIDKKCFDMIVTTYRGKEALNFKSLYFDRFYEISKHYYDMKVFEIEETKMLFGHKDKLKITKEYSYPILNRLNVLPKYRYRVHKLVYTTLLGKYENVVITDKFDIEDYCKKYELQAQFVKKFNSQWFDNTDQITIFEILDSLEV